MKAPYDLITLICALSYVPICLYLIVLWSVVLFRTGLAFAYIFVFCYVASLLLSLVNAVLYISPMIGVHVLGRAGWKVFYYFFVCVQPLNFAFGAIGATFLVLFILRSHRVRLLAEGSNQTMQPNDSAASRSNANLG